MEYLVSIFNKPTNIKSHVSKLIYYSLKQNSLIPNDKTRKEIWLICSNAKYMLTNVFPNYYHDLLNYTNYPDYFKN